jgi:hypothetical protein
MLFTYKDKGSATTLAVRSNQRHLTKYDTVINVPGKPNPIKHWRKQLAPYIGTAVQSKQKSIQDLDDAIKTSDPPCEGHQDILFVEKCTGIEGSTPCVTGSFKVRHSANTIINKKFCWNSKQYLQSRCKTYDQNATIGKNLSDSSYQSTQCTNSCSVIYKPNNKQFAQQGGVSSSSRIAKLKYDTIRSSTATYDSFLANLDNSNTVLSRKPVKCINWVRRGVRNSNLTCPQLIRLNNI